jgi:TP901-1 family phage major tail protein
MAAVKGSLVLLKISNGMEPEIFTTVGGMHATDLMLGNQIADATHVASGAWRQLLADSGMRFISITGSGLFTDAASEEAVRACAFAGTAQRFRLCFAHGGMAEGAFIITQYQRGGEVDGCETCAMRLESAGTITFTPA